MHGGAVIPLVEKKPISRKVFVVRIAKQDGKETERMETKVVEFDDKRGHAKWKENAERLIFLLRGYGKEDLEAHHVCPIYAVFAKGDNEGIVIMPTVAAGSLEQFMQNRLQPLLNNHPKDLMKNWIYCATAGIRWLHLRGIQHLGVKPANILITKESRVLVSDFGAAGMKSNNDGSPRYLAPEQRWKGLGCYVSDEADTFSLGATIFEMLMWTVDGIEYWRTWKLFAQTLPPFKEASQEAQMLLPYSDAIEPLGKYLAARLRTDLAGDSGYYGSMFEVVGDMMNEDFDFRSSLGVYKRRMWRIMEKERNAGQLRGGTDCSLGKDEQSKAALDVHSEDVLRKGADGENIEMRHTGYDSDDEE